MADTPFFTPGIDLLAILSQVDPDCGVATWLTVSQIQALIAAAAPGPEIGFIVVSETEPDIITYPAYTRFTWVKPSEEPSLGRRYNSGTLSWETATFIDNSVSGLVIADHTLTLIKVDPGSGNANKILAVNSAGTSVVFSTIVSAIGTGTITLDKLLIPLTANIGDFLSVTAPSTVGFVPLNLAGRINALANQSISQQKISASGLTDGQVWSWDTGTTAWIPLTPAAVTTVPVPDGGGADDGKILGVVASAYAFVAYPTYTFSDKARGGPFAVPVLGTPRVWAHGQAAIPYNVEIKLRLNAVTSPYQGFVTGQEIDATTLTTTGHGGDAPVIYHVDDATNITVYVNQNYAAGHAVFMSPATGGFVDFDPSKWDMYINVSVK